MPLFVFARHVANFRANIPFMFVLELVHLHVACRAPHLAGCPGGVANAVNLAGHNAGSLIPRAGHMKCRMASFTLTELVLICVT